MFKRLILLILIPISSLAVASDLSPVGGIYLDSFTGLSGKAGFRYDYDQRTPESGEAITSKNWGSAFVYTDVEAGTFAHKINVGLGQTSLHSTVRIGLSFAKKDSQNYLGLEGLTSVFGISFKAGVYRNAYTDNTHFSLGVGFGI